MMKVSAILKSKGEEVYTIAADSNLRDMVREMISRRVGSLLVVDKDGKMQGIVTERDLLRTLNRGGAQWDTIKIADIMSSKIVFGAIQDTVEQAMNLMTDHRIRHLPVMDGDRLAGMLSMGDIIKATLTESNFQNKLLKSYIKNWPEGE